MLDFFFFLPHSFTSLHLLANTHQGPTQEAQLGMIVVILYTKRKTVHVYYVLYQSAQSDFIHLQQ